MPVPTWRLAVVAAAGTLAILVVPGRPQTIVLVFNLLLAVVALADWLAAPRARRLEVRRELPSVVTLGGSADVVWRVRNPLRRRLRVRLADGLLPSLKADTRRATLRIPARGRASARTQITPSRRGQFSWWEITLRVAGPLGLASRQGTIDLPASLRVYPPFASRDEAELRLTRSRVLQVGLRAAQGRGGGTEFDSLREYTIDDEFRRIDWAATARVRKPIVRTYRAERNQTVLILLDSGRTMAGRVGDSASHGPGGPLPRLDHAMDAAMTVVTVATRLGDRAGLVAFADRVRTVVAPGNRRDQLGRVTDALYRLEPALVESDYQGAFVETLARFRRRALLVLITELAEPAVAESLLPALPLVVRDHLVVVAAVRDPHLSRWATAIPAEPGGAYRKAAAVAAVSERTRVTARLRGLGALVVDAEPGHLAGELADSYLRVKSTGRL